MPNKLQKNSQHNPALIFILHLIQAQTRVSYGGDLVPVIHNKQNFPIVIDHIIQKLSYLVSILKRMRSMQITVQIIP